MDQVVADRRASMAGVSARYSGWLHLLGPTAVGLAAAGIALTRLADGVHPAAWLAVPATFVAANVGEWHIHRDLLHQRVRPFLWLYDRHSGTHHRLYHAHTMAMLDPPREFRLVLIPPWAELLLVVAVVPPASLIALMGLPDVAALFLATAVGYVLAYEWLHLAFHLPEAHPLSRWPLMARLRAHHQRHHDPRHMRYGNFNVVFPLWDLVRGTVLPPDDDGVRYDEGGTESPP